MSAEAMGWVYRHSPAKGATLLVHLAAADSANDQHGHELWMRQYWLAAKARVSRESVNKALAWLCEHGLLELLESGKATGSANRYRLLMPELPAVWDSRGGVTRDHRGVLPETTPHVTRDHTPCDQRSQGGVIRDHMGVLPEVTHNSSINPSTNPTKNPKKTNNARASADATDSSTKVDGVLFADGVSGDHDLTANDTANDAGDRSASLGAALASDARRAETAKDARNDGQARGASDGAPLAFDAFWLAYPRRVGKEAARKAWAKAVKTAGTPDAIMAGLAQAVFSDDPKFIPHPATWLNAGRWMDEPDPLVRARGPKISPEFDRSSPEFDPDPWSPEAVAAFHRKISRVDDAPGPEDLWSPEAVAAVANRGGGRHVRS